jgi:flagellar M-ring protein FliF
MASTSNILNTVSTRAKNSTPVQRIVAAAAVLLVISALFFVLTPDNAVSKAPLFADLDAADAAAVLDALEAQGYTSAELADAGTTVLVNRDDVYDLRVQLAATGVPSSSDGFGLLDSEGMTTSEFKQRTDFQRAIQGELATTIEAIDGVRSARVLITMPTDTLFADSAATAKASVLVITENGAVLAPTQVQAITNLVSGAVEGMDAANVVVSDQTGVVLSGGSGGASSAAASDMNAQLRSSFEADIASSLTAAAGRVAGAGNVEVQVSAALNFDEIARTVEDWNPDNIPLEEIPVSSETNDNEVYTGASQNDTGILGPDGAPVDGGDGNQVDYTKESNTRAFAIDRTVSEIRQMPGTVEKMSAAVLLNADTVTAEEADVLAEVLASAAGIDDERGDTLTVARVSFDTSAADDAEAAAEEIAAAEAAAARAERLRQMVLAGVVFAVVATAGLITLLGRRRRNNVTVEPIDLTDEPVIEPVVEPEPVIEPAEDEIVDLGTLDLPVVDDVPDEDELALQAQDRLADIAQRIDTDPDSVAQLLRGLMDEKRKDR